MSAENKLEPCPFCGGSADAQFDPAGMLYDSSIHCSQCLASGPCPEQGETHAEKWNTRAAQPAALRGEVEVFEREMRAMAFQLAAGGYNAKTLTAKQLVEKVQWGINNLAESDSRLIDTLRAENSSLKSILDGQGIQYD